MQYYDWDWRVGDISSRLRARKASPNDLREILDHAERVQWNIRTDWCLHTSLSHIVHHPVVLLSSCACQMPQLPSLDYYARRLGANVFSSLVTGNSVRWDGRGMYMMGCVEMGVDVVVICEVHRGVYLSTRNLWRIREDLVGFLRLLFPAQRPNQVHPILMGKPYPSLDNAPPTMVGGYVGASQPVWWPCPPWMVP